jgi:hypothetical protein
MKKSELKNILKPLVKECIKEALLEEGVLSGIINEVAIGLAGTKVLPLNTARPVEPIVERMQKNAFSPKQAEKLRTHKKKLMAAIGESAYNGVDLFEGTKAAPAPLSAEQQASPLAGQDAADAGVDISGLFGSSASHWNAHMNEIVERK